MSKEIEKLITNIAVVEGMNLHEAFTIWLEMSARSIFGGTLKMMAAEDAWRENEDAYLNIVGRFRKKDISANQAAKALKVLIDAFETHRTDILGPLFMELASNKYQGQFFTPFEVCKLMAGLTINDVKPQIEQEGFVLMSEPACGAGAMVIATSETLLEQGVDINRQVHWVMTDVSWPAICAAYIQCSLLGISADIVHGNTLTLEEWQRMPTPMAVLYPKFKSKQTPVTNTGTYGDLVNNIMEAAE
ncbi:MAG: SAM-dependent DNA methyltransferase [Roseibium sp.]|nr:SAM-dependent DNA methyltransferase [Roseibium sp.]